MQPVSVLDVAAYILSRSSAMTTMKVQKLVYYSQAWSLAWDRVPLFVESIQAWRDGPVVRELFHVHRGFRVVSTCPGGNPDALDERQRATVDRVMEFYGDFDGDTLSTLTHREEPWRRAREGHRPEEYSDREISREALTAAFSQAAGVATEKRVPESVSRGIEWMLSLSEEEFDGLTTPSDVAAEDVLRWLESGDPGAAPWAQA